MGTVEEYDAKHWKLTFTRTRKDGTQVPPYSVKWTKEQVALQYLQDTGNLRWVNRSGEESASKRLETTVRSGESRFPERVQRTRPRYAIGPKTKWQHNLC